MADWTGLAGAAGLASALEEIQNRRIKEAQLQKELTAGQGEWTPGAPGRGGMLGFFDALLGYNKPGEIGFGSQRYGFKPYPTMTEQDAQRLQLTMPETTTTPAYEKPLPPTVQGPLELVPEQQTTREVPLPGFVGRQKLTPEFLKMITMERLQERRDLAKLQREQAFWKDMYAKQGGAGTGAGDLLDGTFTPEGMGGTGGTGAAGTPAKPQTVAAPPTGGPVPGIDQLSPQFRGKAQMIANRLGINLDDFYRVMHFETGGEFSPATKNRAGSGGTGLIQFTTETAKALGTTTDALAQMTPEQQLDYVEKHLAPHKGKMGNLKDLYMAILYPAAVGKSEDTVLFTPQKTPKAYLQNAGLDTGNKGYVTVGDAVAAVQRSTGMTSTTSTATAPPQERAPAAIPAQTPQGEALTNKYAEQFRKGDEKAALKVVTTLEDQAKPDPAHPTQLSPADTLKITAAKQALQQVFPRGQVQAQAPPDTGMQVAGPGAPAPSTATQQSPAISRVPASTTGTQPSTTAQAPTTTSQATVPAQGTAAPTPQAPFQLTPTARAMIDDNNRQIVGINGQLQALRTRREQILSSPVAGTPRGTAFLQDMTAKMSELERDKNTLRDKSRALHEKELAEYRARGTKSGELAQGEAKDIRAEQRKPDVTAATEAAKQQVQQSEDIRNLTRDLKDRGQVDNADFNKLSEPQQAIVIRTAKKYADNKQLVDNLDNYSKAALSQILADDKTPMGEVSPEQITRAREMGAEREKQHKYDQVEAQRLANLNAPMMGFAEKYFHPTLLRTATGSMTVPEAENLGYRLMPVEQQKTLRTTMNSMRQISRINTLLFGGTDTDGSITGTSGAAFVGIYPTLEKGRSDTQSVIARTKMTMQLRKEVLQGTEMGQWANALQRYIQGTLGALSRDLGGERGHFTDFDARRIQGLFADMRTNMLSLGIMTSSGEAKKLMRQVTATISDRARTSGSVREGDALPWDTQGTMRETPAKGSATTGSQSAPAGQTPTGQAPVPTPPAAQEPAPSPAAPTSQRPNAPAAAQPDQRLQQLNTQHPPAQYAGKTIRDPVTGLRYRSDGNAWQEVQ